MVTRVNIRMPVDGKYGLPTRIGDLDPEFPTAHGIPIPFDQTSQYKIILARGKTRCVELIEDAAGIEFAIRSCIGAFAKNQG